MSFRLTDDRRLSSVAEARPLCSFGTLHFASPSFAPPTLAAPHAFNFLLSSAAHGFTKEECATLDACESGHPECQILCVWWIEIRRREKSWFYRRKVYVYVCGSELLRPTWAGAAIMFGLNAKVCLRPTEWNLTSCFVEAGRSSETCPEICVIVLKKIRMWISWLKYDKACPFCPRTAILFIL